MMPETPIQLSPEQQGVVESRDPRLIVTAAAGSGKTSVLVARYVRLIQEGMRPDEILTITFTRKAAAEMKRRIVGRLQELHLYGEAQAAETGPIQTIHSFCERTLRENALSAGLDPNFEILADAEASRLVSQCVREAMAAAPDEAPHAEALLTYLAGRSLGYGEERSPYSALEDAVQTVLREFRGSGLTALELHDRHKTPADLWEYWQRAMQIEAGASGLSLEGADGVFQERLQKALKAQGLRSPSWLRNRPDVAADEEALEHTCGLVQLACAAWWRLDRAMNREQRLDFAALESRAVRLLARCDITRDRIANQYRAVMVDEAQDLNPVQYKLLEGVRSRSQMKVGDPQQSIYGFRLADPDQFRAEADGERNAVHTLRRNYRSDAGILRFVDDYFNTRWQGYVPMSEYVPFDLDQIGPPDYSGLEVWRQASGDLDHIAGCMRQLRDEGVPYGDIAVLVRDGAGAQEMELALRKQSVPCRVAGGTERFFTRLEVRDLANALRAVADPYDDFSLLACLNSPVVGLSMDSIVLLARERPVVERLADFNPALIEDVPRLEAFRAWFEPLRSVADRLAAWEVLAELFARSELLPALARRFDKDALLANVRKLYALATKEPKLGPLEFAERIREIQELRHKEGDAPADEANADCVTIMTIHKAKGLEWPVVVLPQTDRRLGRVNSDLLVDTKKGLVATKFGKGQCTVHKLLTELKKARELEEEERVLYVALTRAKRRLCVCLYPQRTDLTVSKLLHRFLGDPPPPSVTVREDLDEVSL
jgi:ATP-dependent exoDNAse (exonuclease V) beta subunit